MMNCNKYFFIGVGGIGMSSIANYLLDNRNLVLGYDRSSNKLVEKLINHGLKFTNTLDLELIPEEFLNDDVIVIYTPAVKKDNIFLDFFLNKKVNKILKRSINCKIGPRRKGDTEKVIANNKKIKRILKWKPRFNNIDLIINSALKWEKKLKNLNRR